MPKAGVAGIQPRTRQRRQRNQDGEPQAEPDPEGKGTIQVAVLDRRKFRGLILRIRARHHNTMIRSAERIVSGLLKGSNRDQLSQRRRVVGNAVAHDPGNAPDLAHVLVRSPVHQYQVGP